MSTDTLTLLAIALLNALTAYWSWRTRNAATATQIAAEKTETNTNHMREQLVLRTGEAEHARGREEARKEGENKAERLIQSNLPSDQ